MNTIVDCFKHHITTKANKTAFVMLNEDHIYANSLTYYQVSERVYSIAAYLQKNYQARDRVLMIYQAGPEFVIAFLACIHAGLIPVPTSLHSRKPQNLKHLEYIYLDTGAVLILTLKSLQEAISDWISDSIMKDTPCLASDEIIYTRSWKYPDITPDSLAFLQYTSGSTSYPKGVMITHRNLISNCQQMEHCLGNTSDTVFGGWLPFYHDMGLIGLIFQSIYLGAQLIMMSPFAFVRRPAMWLQAISEYKINTTATPNFGLKYCVNKIRDKDIQGIDLSSLTVCCNGSEPVEHKTQEAFYQRFKKYGLRYECLTPAYGLAEATLYVSSKHKSDRCNIVHADFSELSNNRISLTDENAHPAITLVSCGKPYELDLIIVDYKEKKQLDDMKIGEIWISGKNVSQGYWQKEEINEEIFKAALINEPTKLYMRTGDLGFIYQDEVYVTGRLKDMIIFNGRNIYPQDIEQQCQSYNITNYNLGLTIIGNTNDLNDNHIVLIQEINQNPQSIIIDDLVKLSRKFISEIGVNFDIPISNVVFVSGGSVSRTTSGKVQRKKTLSLLKNNELPFIYQTQSSVMSGV